MNQQNSIHQGHRNRLKEKFLKFGPDVFSDHELIEILLFFSILRINTNDTAHKLLERFGSLEALFGASHTQISEVEGVGPSSALLISLVGALMRRSTKNRIPKRKKYSNLEEIGNLLTEQYKGLQCERFLALYFDASMRLIEISTVAEGTFGEAAVSPAKVTREAVLKGASGVIVVHNHPLGASSVSNADRNLTHILEASLAAVDIPLIEHIIVGEMGYAPTMTYKTNPTRSALSAKIYGNSFYKEFYKN